VLWDDQQHQNPFAYEPGKSTERVLHNMVTCIENAVEHKEMALGAFLGADRPFDRTSHEATVRATEEHGMEPTIHG
jgi:hypothetical protein